MGTRETRRQRGKRRGDKLVRSVVSELRIARQDAGISQRALAAELGWYQSEVNRLEQFRFGAVSVVRLAEIASVLGLELSANVYPVGDGVHDRGHQALFGRLKAIVVPPCLCSREVPFPAEGDRRSWDAMLKRGDLLVGVELETHVRDIQACVRRIREREKDGGAVEILLVLADTRHNRRIVQ